jgi:hippurate hydrolase
LLVGYVWFIIGVGFASLFLDQILSIPNNKTIRLLFQPAEENIGGAIVMIKEGCLDGVDEVYGCHQWPTGKIGQVWVKPGPMMSDPIILTIKIIGRGGHASEPHKFINPVMLAARFLVKIHEVSFPM